MMPPEEFEREVLNRLTRLEEQLIALNHNVQDHEPRIRQLENERWKLVGIFTGVAACLSFVMVWLQKRLGLQ